MIFFKKFFSEYSRESFDFCGMKWGRKGKNYRDLGIAYLRPKTELCIMLAFPQWKMTMSMADKAVFKERWHNRFFACHKSMLTVNWGKRVRNSIHISMEMEVVLAAYHGPPFCLIIRVYISCFTQISLEIRKKMLNLRFIINVSMGWSWKNVSYSASFSFSYSPFIGVE